MQPFTLLRLFVLLLLSPFALHAQTYGPDNWQMLGGTNEGTPPYQFTYYKILEVKGNADRYACIVDLSVQADANYFSQQGTYRIRIDKFEGTTDRFDGVEIRCISGNPGVATFYVFNNAVWMRSNFQWGAIFYKTEGNFGYGSPLTGGQWGSTINPPAGYIAETSNAGLKCDFDNIAVFKLPYVNTAGDVYINGKVGIGVSSAINQLVLPNTQYIAWRNPEGTSESVGIATNASNDLSFYVGGPDKMYIKSLTGNVGIGTSDPGSYKLAVEGTIGARKVKVTSGPGWPDFVFENDYKLMPLPDVAQYISAKKHLPGIPSAKEVEKEGIDLGEMNSKLLQKIEEQMLYILDLNRKLEAVTSRLQQLEKEKPANYTE